MPAQLRRMCNAPLGRAGPAVSDGTMVDTAAAEERSATKMEHWRPRATMASWVSVLWASLCTVQMGD